MSKPNSLRLLPILALPIALLLLCLATGCASSSSMGDPRTDVEVVTLPMTVFDSCEEECADSHVRCQGFCDRHDPTANCYRDCDKQTRHCFEDCRNPDSGP